MNTEQHGHPEAGQPILRSITLFLFSMSMKYPFQAKTLTLMHYNNPVILH